MTKNEYIDLEIRKLPASATLKICNIIEESGKWKDLMGVIRVECKEDNELKYTVDQMKLIESAANVQKRLCSEILLDEWGTSGKCRPTVSILLQYLRKANLYRAAEFVAVNLLNEPAPPRPSEGPGRKVQYPSDLIDHGIPSTTRNNGPSAPPMSKSTLEEDSLALEATERLASRSNEVQRLKYSLLESATSKFANSQVLGGGAFGTVYLANLPHIGAVAVKRIIVNGSIGNPVHQFQTEVKVLAQLTHPNLLPLLGYSDDGPELCLAYKFMKHGSLLDQLTSKSNPYILSWRSRIGLGLGTARGLAHLHSGLPRPLVHRDIKSANILLDNNFTPKLGDFGLVHFGSKGIHTNTSFKTENVIGTSAYMAPEAHRGDVSIKLDIFSFGVVLLELITGLPPFDETREGHDLVTYMGSVDEEEETLADKSAGNWPPDVVTELFKLAWHCLENRPKDRPYTDAVVEKLELLLAQS